MTALNVRGLHIDTVDGRPLVRDLCMRLGQDRVAIIGRNGVGKSTLLRALAGELKPTKGSVERRGTLRFVPQILAAVPGSSAGQTRRQALVEAFAARPDLLLLDEPTEDLDESARAWLMARLRQFRGGLLVVSHDSELLAEFSHFFQIAESGCRYLSGDIAAVRTQLVDEERRRQTAYTRTLTRLAAQEDRHQRIVRRRARKKAVGRVHELDRNQSKLRLNERRSSAQVSQAKVRAQSEHRILAKRTWALASRRALKVELGLTLTPPALPATDGPAVTLQDAGVQFGNNLVLSGVNLQIDRDRLAVVGPNGSGKSCLLRVMLLDLQPTHGRVRSRLERVGAIAQGATDWAIEDSLLERLASTSAAQTLDSLAEQVVAHRFPLDLALRPLASLSPGERTRAALICLFQQPGLQVLVLDEPTFSLDLLGIAALTRGLAAWPGGLVVASHDRGFLREIGVHRWLECAVDDGQRPNPIDRAGVLAQGAGSTVSLS